MKIVWGAFLTYVGAILMGGSWNNQLGPIWNELWSTKP